MTEHYFNSFDPMDPYINPLPKNPTPEELDEYYRQSKRMLVRSIAVYFAMLLAMVVISMLTSCSTVKTEHEQTTHVVGTDTTATEAVHSGQVTQQSVDVDAIVAAVWQRTMEEFARQEQEHETITETLTETIDSLGRVVRQSQKTTDRTLSRQEQQRIDRLEQTVTEQIHRAITEHDSLWQDRFTQYQASVKDSLSAMRDLQQQRAASSPLSWWQRFRLSMANVMLYALLIIAAVWILRRKIPWLQK